MDQHPITPPAELFADWLADALQQNPPVSNRHSKIGQVGEYIATQAARWGADQELEACCEWLNYEDRGFWGCKLRTARRPKPPSLKEQALLSIEVAVADGRLTADVYNLIRLALEKSIV